MRGVFHPHDGTEKPEDHVFAMIRKIKGLPQDKSAEGFIDMINAEPDIYNKNQLYNLNAELKRQLGNNCIPYSASWQDGKAIIDEPIDLESKVYNFLEEIIKLQFKEIISPDEIKHEANLHTEFKEKLTMHFCGRQKILNKIKTYLNDATEQKIMSINGESGSGKSSVMAKAIQEYKNIDSKTLIIFRFIGISSNSSNIISLLQSTCEEIAMGFNETLETLTGKGNEDFICEINGITEVFKECLSLVNAQKPIVIFWDAFDQLIDNDNARTLYWLPKVLPKHTKFRILPKKSK